MNHRKILLRNFQSPGDILMLTAAARDVSRALRDRAVVDVRTSVPQLWENNPHLTPLPNAGAGVEVIDCEYPSINDSNRLPGHFLTGFTSFLSHRLGEVVSLTAFKGDIHLSSEERSRRPACLKNFEAPYWIVSAGGKRDFTIKWWEARRFQEVVDHFSGRLQFVQVGAADHFHPKLRNAIDLRGRTSVREVVHLMHHSEGVLTPVSFLMHLAAAVEPSAMMAALGHTSRPCVVVAGGREPPHWEAYPTHQFLHTVGTLECCRDGGCWRSRTRLLGDGSEHDSPRRLCVDVVDTLPRCMDMISAQDVIRRIELYLEGAVVRQRSAPAVDTNTRPAIREYTLEHDGRLTSQTARLSLEKQVAAIPAYASDQYSGRGVVICAGGKVYATCAWVCIRMLRKTGCALPIEVWHMGDAEFPPAARELYKPFGVTFVDAIRVRRRFPVRRLGGWELKAYALVHSRFEEVLLLDADNVPMVDPEGLFTTPQFKKHGAIFWPDLGTLEKSDPIWSLCGLRPRKEPEFESGQMVIDKRRCWKALCLALWLNEHSDFFYKHVHGDKETFHIAFRKLEQPYAMPRFAPRVLKATMCQHDFRGELLFLHRNLDKWRLDGSNMEVPGFRHEAECRKLLKELEQLAPAAAEFFAPAKKSLTPDEMEPPTAAARPPQPLVQEKQPTVWLDSAPRRIVFRGPVNAYTGYGLHSLQIVSDLRRFGHQVAIRPTEISESFARIPMRFRRLFALKEQPEEWELLLHPPNIAPTPGKKTIFFTMWEASRLPQEWVHFLNQAECVVVPCQWNATSFSASGVDRPIRIVPLGIKTQVFRYMPMKMDGPTVFGTAGKMRGGGERKSLNDAISLFQKTFPSDENVRLHIKGFPDCGVHTVDDPRVEITTDYLNERELARWYSRLTCFVSLSRSEGWGLMPHQAMAIGRPCIAVAFGGHAEFVNEHVGYPANFRLVPAKYNYHGGGVWAEPDYSHIACLMQDVHARRYEAQQLGIKASESVIQYKWESSNLALLKVLREFGMCTEKPAMDNTHRPKRYTPHG